MVIIIEQKNKFNNKLKNERQYDEIIYLSPDGVKLNQKISNKLSLVKSIGQITELKLVT